jgi:hypothetical protein
MLQENMGRIIYLKHTGNRAGRSEQGGERWQKRKR